MDKGSAESENKDRTIMSKNSSARALLETPAALVTPKVGIGITGSSTAFILRPCEARGLEG
jgi:hypothetical protein